MCSSGRLCAQGGRPHNSSNHSTSSGSHYALCALGVGLIALGIVMIVWSVVPSSAAGNSSGSKPSSELNDSKGKTSSVAFVLVGAGVAMLLLSICLSVRNKHRQQRREAPGTHAPYGDGLPTERHPNTPDEPAPMYDVPTYEEVIGSEDYPVRQSNLRNSTSLPSYESLADALENEANAAPEDTRDGQPAPPAAAQPPPTAAVAQPARQNSRSGRKLKPVKVRRIKSEKLHLKDVRLDIRHPAQGGLVTIEPLTPPPQYEDKPPQL
ncbi:transmembrane protein 51b [Amia ocellicauda]|uniref:transmembrane protein 51b n=1 Tax=Amia ocellicauda TaxID=2972642 RepID=UPI0034641CFD|nr:TMM51 protein [Amia calva]